MACLLKYAFLENVGCCCKPWFSQPMRCFLTEDVPAAFTYFVVFPRDDAGFLQGCVGGCLTCGLCQHIHLHVLLWCFGNKQNFRMELQFVQFVKHFRTSYFKRNSRKWLVVVVAGCAREALVKMVKPASVIMYCILLVHRSHWSLASEFAKGRL